MTLMVCIDNDHYQDVLTLGDMYEVEESTSRPEGESHYRVSAKISNTNFVASRFRPAKLDDAWSRTHWLDGTVTEGTTRSAVSPGLEKPYLPGLLPKPPLGERPAYALNPPIKPSELQVGGDHYKKAAIQPAVFAEMNGLSHLEANVVKRVYRHSRGGKGREDIEKAIHELQLLLELRY